ncbi:aminodeoxychorismate/anthranilate synthase component II [Pseudenhygromyxa sp. WMMC2535]|nr:aminodeoxychorismate/anthranilate synthase component II [Pseudenhygromyxa sp. WMMC2535]NVB39190.1 aminodeoxychorismate/anthranilate synthase component II [Pseudenhygromyxa sp. WMMC2535]
MRPVVIDNYDSFVFNIVQLIGELTGVEAQVFRNDQVRAAEVAACAPTHLFISPGPGRPEDPAYFGVCSELISSLGRSIPVLGVCLGHQGIGAAFGARVIRAPAPMHGKTSRVVHAGDGLFAGLPSPLSVMRYHSLILDADSLPAALRVTSRSEDGLIMSVVHREWPIAGVQFHPESIGTEHGAALLSNFLSWGPGPAGRAGRAGSGLD